MTKNGDEPKGGTRRETRNVPPPPPRRIGRNRILILSLLAMAFGYFAAGRVGRLWRDNAGAVREFETMRTYARIVVPEDAGLALTPGELAERAEQAVREVNDLMSPFGETSDVRRLNQAGAGVWVEVSPVTWMVTMEALRWHRLTGGAFDPSIGPIKRLFVFDRTETASWPTPERLAEARAKTGAEKLRFDREGMRLSWEKDGMLLDFGAIAKGYAVDRAASVLLANGVKNAMIDVGGEIRVLGEKPGPPPAPWRVGVRNPRNADDVKETIDLVNAAVATSGDYENYLFHEGKRYEHIIDPRIGLPLAEGVAGATVIHPDSCMLADALATTMCVLGPVEGREFLQKQALGLFRRGVRVILYLAKPEGGDLRRLEFTVDDAGAVTKKED